MKVATIKMKLVKNSTKKRKTSDPVVVGGENPIPKLGDNKKWNMEN